jgi:hypothetical protein
MTGYFAFGSFHKFESWLGTILRVNSVQAKGIVQAFLQGSLVPFVDRLSLTTSEKVELETEGVMLESPEVGRLLEMINTFRHGIPLSTIFRFASWGISAEKPEEARKSVFYGDPPDSVVVASTIVPVPVGVIRSTRSLTGRTMPSQLTYLHFKSHSKSAGTRNQLTPIGSEDTEENKATGFGDIGGFRDWLSACSGLPKEIRDKAPTKLANALLSVLKDGIDRTQKVLGPDRSLGIGTDGVYLASGSHDSLLRLIIWVQCSLACEGVALSVWSLNSGHPHYNKKHQPSGSDYFKLLEMAKGKTNGDIVVTESFVQHLTRPELASLIASQPVGDKVVYKVLWWAYPLRVAPERG